MPPAHLLPERTAGVLAVLYLMFNEGYSATPGTELIRAGLCDEAIRLGRALQQMMPDEPEVSGLLALMLLQHSRRHARALDRGFGASRRPMSAMRLVFSMERLRLDWRRR